MKNNFRGIKKAFLTVIFTVIFCGIGFGQSTIWTEDFSTGSNYSVTLGGEGEDGSADYFIRTDDNTGHDINQSYTNTNGFFFAGQDIDDGGWTNSASPSQLTWTGINISSYTSLSFSGNFASVATNKIDASDYVHIEYRIDGGSWTNLIWFKNNGSNYNTYFMEDTDFDGTGDGTQLTAAFSTFTKSITGTGSTLDIRITLAINAEGEDFAFDEFEITGEAPKSQPTNHAASFTATVNGHNQIDLSWLDNDGTQAADGFLIKANTGGTFTDPTDATDPTEDTDLSDGSALVKVLHGTQSYSFTGLTASTQYYFKIWSYTNSGSNIDFKTDGTVPTDNATTAALVLPDIWINEIHYDNDGTDQNEFIEIALINASNYTLSDFTIYLYNGNGGANYNSKTLDLFTVGSTYDNTTLYTYTYPVDGIQNGNPDGMAISWDDGSTEHLIQFLSYGGTFVATDGPANGQTSTNIGVSETSTTLVGHSLQLVDNNAKGYNDYVWSGPATATMGTENSDGSDNQTLPINLTSFTAENNQNFNLINWTTASETNNAFFTLEKSFNALDFFEIAQIKGAGNSISELNYQFHDFETSDKTVYYRLKQTDFDGSSTYSEIISVDNNKKENFSILNHFTTDNQININIKSYQHQSINLNITNLNGQIIFSKEIKISNGINNLKIDKLILDNSIYFVTIYSHTYLETIKIISI